MRLIHPGETPCGILKRQLLPMLVGYEIVSPEDCEGCQVLSMNARWDFLCPFLQCNVHIGCPKLDRHSADTRQLIATQLTSASSAKCELSAPPEKESGAPELGMIFIPGAQISGELYAPLAEKLQSEFPGKLWVGLTENWWVNMPNPIQIGPMIEACFVQAR